MYKRGGTAVTEKCKINRTKNQKRRKYKNFSKKQTTIKRIVPITKEKNTRIKR